MTWYEAPRTLTMAWPSPCVHFNHVGGRKRDIEYKLGEIEYKLGIQTQTILVHD